MNDTPKRRRSTRPALALVGGIVLGLAGGIALRSRVSDPDRDAALAAALAQTATAKLATGDAMAAELDAAEAVSLAADPSALGTLLLLAGRWRPSLIPAAAPICATLGVATQHGALACGGARELLLLDPRTVKITRRISAAADAAIAISPRGTLVAAASFDAGLGVWDVDSGQRLWRSGPGERGAVFAIAFATDGSRVLVGGDGDRARVLDAATGETLAELVGHNQRISAVAFAADGELVATGAWDQTVRLWDPYSGESEGLLVGHDGGVTALCFSPDGTQLASVSEDRSVRVWRLESGDEVRRFAGHRDALGAIAFSSDGRLLASGDAAGAIRVWDVERGRERVRLTTWGAAVTALAFAAGDERLIVAGAGQPLRIWDLDGLPPGTPAQTPGAGLRIVFANDAELLATTDHDGTVRLWDGRADSADAALTRLRHPAAVRATAFSADDELLATGCDDGKLRLWRVADGELHANFAARGAGATITDVAFAPDGTRILWSQRGAAAPFVSFFLPDGRPAPGPTAAADDGLAVAASEHWLAGGTRWRVYLWEAVSGKEVWHRDIHREGAGAGGWRGSGARSLRFSPDGRELYAAGWDDAIHAWSVPSGQRAAQFVAGSGVTDLHASAGGGLLAGLGADGAWLWDISSRRLIARFAALAPLGGVALANDGSQLGLLEHSGTVLRVDLSTLERPPQMWLARARRELGAEPPGRRAVGASAPGLDQN